MPTIKWLAIASLVFLMAGCSSATQAPATQGTSWGEGVFTSNGERIYFTSTDDQSNPITYTGGPSTNGWMMMSGQLACASCHGPDGRGGVHNMGMMEVMEAPDIRWTTLDTEYTVATFKRAVEDGIDPDSSQLSTNMPRWKMSDADLDDLIAFLKTLP
jgi:cytochrome c1